ncbi:hypothetical protein [Enterococcus durans]|uniref:hypothetical protein n=1 Tax=Enterococcus durans TaxID=53345 RepID=UPI00071BBF82|nr:hypothetical protein [Enterococcus durans]KST48904.1 hypothetical protein AOY33_10620 [Enterococcus durans]
MNIDIKKIKFEGRTLRVLKATATEMKGVDNNKNYDFDLYHIEARSPISTREISLYIDFIDKEVSGDIIAFGSWYDLETESVIEVLKQFKKENQLLRDCDFI